MSPSQRAGLVLELGVRAGFARIGIARSGPLPRADYVNRWLELRRHGEMGYLQRWHELRADPSKLLPGARSIIVVADNYRQEATADTPKRQNGGPGSPVVTDEASPSAATGDGRDSRWARVAQYAWGRDYHRVLRKKLKGLVAKLKGAIDEPFEARICVDTAPIVEREVAALAGIGWIGKNTMVLHQDLGSFFFLGEVVTTLELEASTPATDHCGTCTRCLDACPTGAFTAPYQMDATRCISYLTIEHRSEIASELQPLMGEWIYGCDICQDVCPYNQDAPLSTEPAYACRTDHPLLPAPDPRNVEALSEEEYRRLFQGSAMRRATLAMLKRNAEIVVRNGESLPDKPKASALQTPPTPPW